jgi:hypothetical protein
MKATAQAHPIQGLIKYHGLRNAEHNIPYHDSISVCTAPSKTRTTVEFSYGTDSCLVNGVEIDDEGYERVTTVLNYIRNLSDIDTSEGVIELFSHRDGCISWIVSAFVNGDSDDEPQTQRKEHLRSCVNAASGAKRPEAAVFDCIVRSLNLCPAVVRLV